MFAISAAIAVVPDTKFCINGTQHGSHVSVLNRVQPMVASWRAVFTRLQAIRNLQYLDVYLCGGTQHVFCMSGQIQQSLFVSLHVKLCLTENSATEIDELSEKLNEDMEERLATLQNLGVLRERQSPVAMDAVQQRICFAGGGRDQGHEVKVCKLLAGECDEPGERFMFKF